MLSSRPDIVTAVVNHSSCGYQHKPYTRTSQSPWQHEWEKSCWLWGCWGREVSFLLRGCGHALVDGPTLVSMQAALTGFSGQWDAIKTEGRGGRSRSRRQNGGGRETYTKGYRGSEEVGCDQGKLNTCMKCQRINKNVSESRYSTF